MAALASWIGTYKPILALLYLSALGALCVSGVDAYLKVPVAPGVLFVFMAFVFGIYLLNRTTDSDEDILNDQSRIVFYMSRNFYFGLALAILMADAVFLVATQKFHWIHAVLLTFGVCYSFKVIPWIAKNHRMIFIRIKEVIWLKNLSVALLWGGSVVIIPSVYSGVSPFSNPVLLLIGLGLFISSFNNTLFDDVRDLEGDRAAGIKTLPTEYGVRFSYLLLFGLDVIWSSALVFIWKAGMLNFRCTAFLECLSIYPMVYLGLFKFVPGQRFWNSFLAEGDLFVFGLGLFLISR